MLVWEGVAVIGAESPTLRLPVVGDVQVVGGLLQIEIESGTGLLILDVTRRLGGKLGEIETVGEAGDDRQVAREARREGEDMTESRGDWSWCIHFSFVPPCSCATTFYHVNLAVVNLSLKLALKISRDGKPKNERIDWTIECSTSITTV